MPQVQVEHLLKSADAAVGTPSLADINADVRSRASSDIGNMFLLAGLTGLGGRGLIGMLRNAQKPTIPSTAGPAELPLPYPVKPELDPTSVFRADSQLNKKKQAADGASGGVDLNFDPAAWLGRQTDSLANWSKSVLLGRQATTKGGLPYYAPGMMLAGVGGLYGGWKAMDYTLKAQEEARRKAELERARGQFHDALISQYDAPLSSPPKTPSVRGKRAEEETTMEKVGQELDKLYDRMQEKQALGLADLAGGALGAYGLYALPAAAIGATAGYSSGVANSDRKILEAAMRQRERAKFMAQPTEVYAIPEPIEHIPKPDRKEEVNLLKSPGQG